MVEHIFRKKGEKFILLGFWENMLQLPVTIFVLRHIMVRHPGYVTFCYKLLHRIIDNTKPQKFCFVGEGSRNHKFCKFCIIPRSSYFLLSFHFTDAVEWCSSENSVSKIIDYMKGGSYSYYLNCCVYLHEIWLLLISQQAGSKQWGEEALFRVNTLVLKRYIIVIARGISSSCLCSFLNIYGDLIQFNLPENHWLALLDFSSSYICASLIREYMYKYKI